MHPHQAEPLSLPTRAPTNTAAVGSVITTNTAAKLEVMTVFVFMESCDLVDLVDTVTSHPRCYMIHTVHPGTKTT